MIKGLTVVRAAHTPAAYEKLVSFFSVLGFENGRGWNEESSRASAFLAPIGNLEIVDGQLPAIPEILVEVVGLDAAHAVASKWLDTEGGSVGSHRIGVIEASHWKSRMFTVEPVEGLHLAFWEFDNAWKGRPIAVEGDLSAAGMKFAIVVARWNAVITDRLLQGALDALYRSGASKDSIQIVRVPGAWEIPSAARSIAAAKQADAVITLGCLIRGETAHYEAIYNEVARGIGQSQQETGIPHAFGVLTCETLEQALNRAGIKAGNKGFEAAVAAIEMVSLHRKLATSVTA